MDQYNQWVDEVIQVMESHLTSSELAEVRELVAHEKSAEALWSMACIIGRRGLSIPIETRRSIAHLAGQEIERNRWPESFLIFMPLCKGCGNRIIYGLLKPKDESEVEYCWGCNPDRPRTRPSHLDRMDCVPSAYRKLVELGILDFNSCPCGDVEFYMGDALFEPRIHLEVFQRHSHLQPFAQTGSGEFWCWTGFRTGPSGPPEILLINDGWQQVTMYAPTFETFLYRNALKELSGHYDIAPNESLPGILEVAQLLRKVGAESLANDLESLSRQPVKDCTPEAMKSREMKLLGWITKEEMDARIEQILGRAYLDSEPGPDFFNNS